VLSVKPFSDSSWSIHHSNKNETFYYNKATGESLWDTEFQVIQPAGHSASPASTLVDSAAESKTSSKHIRPVQDSTKILKGPFRNNQALHKDRIKFDQNSESSQGVSTAENAEKTGSCLCLPGASYEVEQQVGLPESDSPVVTRHNQSRRIVDSESGEGESSTRTKAGGWSCRNSDAVSLRVSKHGSKSGGENQTPWMC
jgi:hypothetical protein